MRRKVFPHCQNSNDWPQTTNGQIRDSRQACGMFSRDLTPKNYYIYN